MAITRAVLVLWQSDPRHPDKAAAPLVYALCARALDMEVEIHLTSSAVAWAFEGLPRQPIRMQSASKRFCLTCRGVTSWV